jgi:hypothetical protein
MDQRFQGKNLVDKTHMLCSKNNSINPDENQDHHSIDHSIKKMDVKANHFL